MTTKGTYGRFSGKTRYPEGTYEGTCQDGGKGTYERGTGGWRNRLRRFDAERRQVRSHAERGNEEMVPAHSYM